MTLLPAPGTDTAPDEKTEEGKEKTPSADKGSAAVWLLVLGIAVHLLFLLSLRFGWLNPLFNDTTHRFGPGGDFFSIYAAGIKARAGESIYTVGGHVEAVPYAYAFRYAPLVAYTLGAALSLLPAIAAYAVWLTVCELVLLHNIRQTLEIAPDKRTGYMAASLWLLFTPYYLELFVGQFTFVTASLVFWAYLGWQKPTRSTARKADALWAIAVWLNQTCGPAALAAVCRHYGIAATEPEIARLAGTTSGGTSMLGLQTAARAKGLAAEGERRTLCTLAQAPCPSILFFQPGHFAVLTGVRGAVFYLADPSLGQRSMTASQLGALWHGELLLVGPATGSRASGDAL